MLALQLFALQLFALQLLPCSSLPCSSCRAPSPVLPQRADPDRGDGTEEMVQPCLILSTSNFFGLHGPLYSLGFRPAAAVAILQHCGTEGMMQPWLIHRGGTALLVLQNSKGKMVHFELAPGEKASMVGTVDMSKRTQVARIQHSTVPKRWHVGRLGRVDHLFGAG